MPAWQQKPSCFVEAFPVTALPTSIGMGSQVCAAEDRANRLSWFGAREIAYPLFSVGRTPEHDGPPGPAAAMLTERACLSSDAPPLRG